MFGNKNEKQPDLEFFTVFDSKSKSYAEPFPAPNKEVLMRDFMNAFKKAAQDEKSNNKYYTNAEDFSLFKVGTFDFKTGTLEATKMEHVVNLHDLRALTKPSVGPVALLPT